MELLQSAIISRTIWKQTVIREAKNDDEEARVIKFTSSHKIGL